ncbi:MAG: GerMN domain-containing protein [Eubacteriales bacterium]|nr:GerMN domain-containing protein [Eubacteriales bacterium]MDD3349990.1 GerMN domain-containing protein [Eubacteriales bacterium]
MMNRKKNAVGLVLLMLITMFLMGCGEVITEPEEPTMVSEEFTLYYASKEYEETGDENLPKLIAEVRTIEYEKDSNPGIAMLNELKKPEKDGSGTAIKEGIIFLDVRNAEEDDITVVVDLSSEGLSGGSLEETLFIDQIVQTILNNRAYFTSENKSVEQVQFLVDGQVTESLMGHIDATEPFTEGF